MKACSECGGLIPESCSDVVTNRKICECFKKIMFVDGVSAPSEKSGLVEDKGSLPALEDMVLLTKSGLPPPKGMVLEILERAIWLESQISQLTQERDLLKNSNSNYMETISRANEKLQQLEAQVAQLKLALEKIVFDQRVHNDGDVNPKGLENRTVSQIIAEKALSSNTKEEPK